jgi:hypothetical protein
MERAGTITALIAARVILIVITLSILPADGRTALGADAVRFLQIARSSGRPYRDFEVEVPPISLAAIEVLAVGASDPKTVASRLVWIMLACDLVAAALLGWAWGERAAVDYLILGLPVAFFVYFRLDLLSVVLAVLGMALLQRARPALGALSLVAAAFAKVWPVVLVPALAVRGRWREFWLAVGAGLIGTAAWVLDFGSDGPRQVLTFRGATGWGIESTIGLPIWALTKRPARFESGAFRVGTAPASVRVALLLATFAVVGWVWLHASDVNAAGTASVAALTAVLLLSPHTSLQWIVWTFPWVAISGEARLRVWALAAGCAASGVYIAATVGGSHSSGVAIGFEFVRIVAIAAMFLLSAAALRTPERRAVAA